MIQATLYDALISQSTVVTLLLLSAIAYLLASRKERSLKLWATLQIHKEVESLETWGESFGEKLIDSGTTRLETSKEEFQNWVESRFSTIKGELGAELNQWSANSIESLRTWLMGNLEAIGAEMVGKPIKEVMTSSLMSNLGKMSGVSRQADAIVNGISNDAMPENLRNLKDQLVKRFPSLKAKLKNPGQIVELAQSFGIDVGALMNDPGGQSSNSPGGSWK